MALAAVVLLPLGLLVLLSGLIVNFIQALLFVLVRPFSKSVYRKINRVVTEMLWLEVIWLSDWWANIKVIGWSMYFSDYIFLDRNWAKDENMLQSGFQQLNDFPQPFWLAFLPEGTRFTQAKLAAAQEYAAAAGLPVPRNVLIPRTKGFVSAVNNLRSFVPAIYNITIAVPKKEPRPTMWRIIRGKSSVVHVHIKRHSMEELPETDSGISQWCKDIFVEKDALLELHLKRDTFNDKERQQIGRPKKSLFVVMFWSCILIFGAVELFQWCTFSWGEITFGAVFMALIMISVQILVQFTKSEYSTPPRVFQRDALKDSLLPK